MKLSKEGRSCCGVGMRVNVLRLLMPLTITDEMLEEGIVILDKALAVSA